MPLAAARLPLAGNEDLDAARRLELVDGVISEGVTAWMILQSVKNVPIILPN
jgi:hypothetical protein